MKLLCLVLEFFKIQIHTSKGNIHENFVYQKNLFKNLTPKTDTPLLKPRLKIFFTIKSCDLFFVSFGQIASRTQPRTKGRKRKRSSKRSVKPTMYWVIPRSAPDTTMARTWTTWAPEWAVLVSADFSHHMPCYFFAEIYRSRGSHFHQVSQCWFFFLSVNRAVFLQAIRQISVEVFVKTLGAKKIKK